MGKGAELGERRTLGRADSGSDRMKPEVCRCPMMMAGVSLLCGRTYASFGWDGEALVDALLA